MILRCASGLDECDCECHGNPDVRHMMACCHQCPHCRRNIVTALYDGHVETCDQRPRGAGVVDGEKSEGR